MIRNNLSLLMAARNLKATRIAADTGIARSTLSNITNNSSKMIQLETVNMLCQYLEIQPSDFFDYLPFDLVFSSDFDQDVHIADSYVKNSLDKLSSIVFRNLELDGFLKKIQVSSSTGTQKSTYDLTIRIEDCELQRHDLDNIFNAATLNIDVLLGDSKDSSAFLDSYQTFDDLWLNQLTTGFQTEIKQIIIDSTTEKIHQLLIDHIKQLIKKYNPTDETNLDEAIALIKRIKAKFSFSFQNAFKQEREKPFSIITFA